MSLFDELVARYRNMNYGNLSGNNPSAVRSLLDEYNDRTYTQVLDPSQVTYLGDVPQNQWFYDDQNHLQFGMPGEGVQGGLVGDETTGTTGWPTYDPYTDYGDPGYAGVIPGEGEVGQGLINEVIQRGGSGEGRDRHNRMRAEQQLRSEIAENLDKFNMLPSYKESELPNLLGFFDETVSNFSREQQINNIMRDIKASKEFGQNKYGLDTSYKGSAGTDTSGGAEPTSGPSGVTGDADLGKGIPGLGDPNANGDGGGQNGGDPSANGMGGMTGGGWCFDPDTLIQMEDGSEKKIKEVQIGDKTLGGEVTGVVQFKPNDEIHNYKGVIVAGSHFVKENGKFIPVADSLDSVKINIIPVVYSLDTTDRRIWINDIEFADFNGDGIAKQFLYNAGVDLTGFDQEVLRQVEHKLM